MKKHLIQISMIAALAAGGGYAQSYPELQADVPFNFIVGGKTLPAGQYYVETPAITHTVMIQSTDRKETGAVLGITATSESAPTPARLVFHRYGDQYFLAEVWTRDSATGRKIPESSRERELAAQRSVDRGQQLVALR